MENLNYTFSFIVFVKVKISIGDFYFQFITAFIQAFKCNCANFYTLPKFDRNGMRNIMQIGTKSFSLVRRQRNNF